MESDKKPYNGVEQAELRCWGDKEKIWKSRKGGNNSGSMTITSPPLVGPQFPSHVPAKSGRHRFNPGPACPHGSRAPPQISPGPIHHRTLFCPFVIPEPVREFDDDLRTLSGIECDGNRWHRHTILTALP